MSLKRAGYIENREAEEQFAQMAKVAGWDSHSRMIVMESFLTQNGLFPAFIEHLKGAGFAPDLPAQGT